MVKLQLDALRASGGAGGAGGLLGGQSFNISSKCRDDLIRLAEAILRRETWALQSNQTSGLKPNFLLISSHLHLKSSCRYMKTLKCC